MRVVFLGTPGFAVPSLRALLQSPYEVCAVFTQPDRPSGRGHRLQPPPIKIFASENNIPVFQPEKIRNEENRALFEQLRPDFIAVAAFGQILPRWLLRAASIAPVNVHASLLPRYRGAAPVVWAILNGDAVSGITTMLMDEHLDTGPMLLRTEIPVADTMTAGELESKLAECGASLLLETLDGLRSGAVRPVPQDDAQATLAPRITKEMAHIVWEKNAADIHNMVRAFNPWPVAFSNLHDQRIQVLRSWPESAAVGQCTPGAFLGFTREGIRVQCGAGTVLEILQVQLPSKRPVSGREFGIGARLRPDEVIFRTSGIAGTR